jgi:hypothetical protein
VFSVLLLLLPLLIAKFLCSFAGCFRAAASHRAHYHC